MSILFPTGRKIPDRKYHEAAVRGRFESTLRVIRGRIDTTGPTILEGVGFTIAKNGTGDVTVTFDPPFSAIPTTVAIVDETVGGAANVMSLATTAPTASMARIRRVIPGTGNVDGGFHFVTIGPIT